MTNATRIGPSCGIRVAMSAESALAPAVAEVAAELGQGPFEHIVVFFSTSHDAAQLSAALAAAFPDTPVSGCTTAGEITPLGMMQGSLMLLAFPKHGFRVRTTVIEDMAEVGVKQSTEVVRSMLAQFARGGPGQTGSLRDRVFALMLVDGLSNAEETLVAAIHWAIDDVQMIGGSAGDNLAFHETALIHGGRVYRHSALLMMVESAFPFRVFKTENFEPTPIKLVVTAADPENRKVLELNAEPAAREYAAAIGLLPDDLGPFSFASYPLVVKVGGDYYCRSIRNMNDDGSLSFFCAIDEGLVFTVARPRDMVRATESALNLIEAQLGGIDMVIGFDCILRRLDAEARQIGRELDALYRRFHVVGFHTYGEQYNAMHLNQTLTGIAFGHGAPLAP